MSRLRIGKCTTLTELGTGAGSRVFQVRREADAREYALKVVAVESRPQRKYLEQAKHEFRVGQMFDHPNLVKVHAFEIETDWLFRPKQARLLLEFAPGKAIDKLALLSTQRLIRVFERVADALAHMHDRGVFHADLKPRNLILGPGTDVKVIDYGLAWIEGEPKARLQGTPEYMAPETASRKQINARTDIFNLGAALYRLVVYRTLPVTTSAQLLDERTFTRMVPHVGTLNPSAPRGLCDLIHWCLEYNPERRPQRMIDVQHALADLAAECKPSDAGS
jgi:serine/threonine protein kinase